MKILISGDFCPIGRTEDFLNKEDYKGLFHDFPKIIDKVDYSIVNFECPFTDSQNPISKSGPNIKTDNPNAFKALKYAGFDMLTLANNHIQDYGDQGVKDTLIKAKEHNFEIIGAGTNKSDAKKAIIKEIKGKKLGFLNIAENEFCAATNDEAGAYTFDLIDNLKLILDIKLKVDKLILIYHGGREHYQLPSPDLRKRFRFFIESGVDAIVAHHPHCFGGYEYYNGKPIVYSLGNFIFDYKKKYQTGKWTEGMSVILNLRDTNFELEFIPHLQGKIEDSTLRVLKDEERADFLERVETLKGIIENDNLFINEWKKYIKSQEAFYLSSMYVKNIYFRLLFMKGILPISLLKNKHNKLLLNLMRCEAHHEISKSILNNY